MGVTLPLSHSQRGPYIFKIQGQVHHFTPTSIRPGYGTTPVCAQLYFLVTSQDANIRMDDKHNTECDETLMRQLSEFMEKNNILAKSLQMMKEVEEEINPTLDRIPNLFFFNT